MSGHQRLATALWIIGLALLLPALPAAASPDEFGSSRESRTDVEPDEILLNDGTLLRGTIVASDDETVTIETVSLGRMVIQRSSITRMARADQNSGVVTDPDYNSLMFCPTPATLARGDAYFRNFELFFLNFGGGVTEALDLSVGTMFPVSSELLMLSLGGKWRLLDREADPVGLALVGSFTMIEDVWFGGPGVVVGLGDRRRSFNLAVNHVLNADDDSETIFLAGVDAQAGRRVKFFVEFMSSSSLIDDDDEFHGFINLGLRFFGQRHSFSLAGLRPLDEDLDNFILFPMVMYSTHW